MGFWTDLGNIAVGAIEKDRENTKEKFAIRAEELQANRASLIKRKDKRYDKDIENYEKEKEKYDTLKSAASNFKNGTIDERTYAALYHTTTLGDKFANLDKTTKENLISSFDGKTADYKLTGSVDEIEKKYAVEEANINKITAEKLKDARGDSFLVKKIIGESNSAKQSLEEQVNSALKAHNTVMSETSISGEDSTLVGIPVKVGGDAYSAKYKKFKGTKGSDKYQTEWSKQRDKIQFGISNQEAFNFIETAKINGGGDELSFKYDKTDDRITGLNQPAIANINALEYAFNTIKENDDNMINNFFNVDNGLYGTIGKNWNESVIYKKTNKVLDGRWGNIERGKITDNVFTLGLGDNVRLTTFVPLSLVNQDSNIVIGDTAILVDKKNMKELSTSMNNFILNQAKKIKGDGNLQAKAQLVYKRLYTGDRQTLNEFITDYTSQNRNSDLSKNILTAVDNKKNKEDNIVKGDKLETTETPKVETPKTEKKSKINYVVTKVDGKDGLAINGKFKTWEEIEAANAVKDLPEEQQNQFNEWKSKPPLKSPFESSAPIGPTK